MRKLSALAWVALFAVTACSFDPNDPRHWIKKLDDPRQTKEAVRMLVKLRDKAKVEAHQSQAAVPPLMELFKKNRDPQILKELSLFNDPQTIPLFVDQMEYTEDSFDAAATAAQALGDMNAKEGVDALIKAVTKPMPVKTRANVVKLESMNALAKIRDPRAADALAKVLSTSADEQDFFLNQRAAQSLAHFNDPKAVPALIRGLFMVGRGANIFQECRTALVGVGEGAVDKLVEALQRKFPDLEQDAKKYEFFPGIIVQKTSEILGDIRSPKAVPALLEQLDKPDEGAKAAAAGKGVSEHEAVIQALGKIGDPAAVKPLIAILADKKRHYKERKAACEGLNVLGDFSAMPAMLVAANTPFIDPKKKEIDPEAAQLAATCGVNYARLANAEGNPDSLQKIPDKDPDSDEDWFADIRIQFKAARDRMAVARECKSEVACYEKYLTDKDENKAEKAAFMLSRLGKEALAPLCKHVDTDSALARMTILFAIQHIGDKNADCVAAMDKQIDKDKGKPQPYRMLVQEMRTVRAGLNR